MADAIQATGWSLEALQRQFQAITHNLSNADTVGYKSRRASFARVLEPLLQNNPATAGLGGRIVGNISADLTQGALTRTGRALDLALDGEGFFVIETPEGPLYTRSGTFRANEQNQLVDAAGRTVAGDGGQIVIPNTVSTEKVHVSRDGTVSAGGQSIGKLRIVKFDDPGKLVPLNASCFRAPAGATPQADEQAEVHQGYRETSNVNIVEEMVNLIMVTRMYEANLKTVTVQDERMKSILQVAMS